MDMILNWINQVKKFFAVVAEHDFEYGFVNGVLFALGIVIFFLIIKLIFKIIFRVRRTKTILINPKDKSGKIILQVSAVEAAIREDIAHIHSVSVNKIKIYRSKSAYFLLLNCNYDGKDGNLLAIRDIINKRLNIIFKEFFSVKNLKKIDIAFSKVAYFNSNQSVVDEVVSEDKENPETVDCNVEELSDSDAGTNEK